MEYQEVKEEKRVVMNHVYIGGEPSHVRVWINAEEESLVSLEGEEEGGDVEMDYWFEGEEGKGMRRDSVSSKSDGYDSEGSSRGSELDDDFNEMFHEESVKRREISVSTNGYIELFAEVRALDDTKLDERNSFISLERTIVIENKVTNDKRSIKLVVKACRSLMECEASQVVFYDCVPSKTYWKEVSIWNRSEIELAFRCISLDSDIISLEAHDSDASFQAASRRVLVPGYSHKRIRVIYRPQRPGDFKYIVFIENIHNAENHERLNVHTHVNNVGPKTTPDLLVRIMSSDTEVVRALRLDDCLLGNLVTKRLRVKNTTDRELECELSSSSPFVSFSFDQRKPQPPAIIGGEDSMPPPVDAGALSPVGIEPAQTTPTPPTPSNDDETLKKGDGMSIANGEEKGHDHHHNNNVANVVVGEDGASTSTPLAAEEEEEEGKTDPGGEVDTKDDDDNQTTGSNSSNPADGENDDDEDDDDDDDEEDEDEDDEDELRPKENGTKSKQKSAIAPMVLGPGMEKIVVIRYRPGPLDAESESKQARLYQLRRRDFLLHFSQAVIIPASVRVCKNGIRLSTNELNFGDCNIGIMKTKMLRISNICDLPSKVKIRLHSKVISIYLESNLDEKLVGGALTENTIELEPRSSKTLTVRFVARKVNLNYEKSIAFESVDCDQTLMVKASNMDSHHIIYHSLFYKLIDKSKHYPREVLQGQKQHQYKPKEGDQLSEIEFGELVHGSPSIRSFEIQNITTKPLRLRFSTSGPNLKCFSLDPGTLKRNSMFPSSPKFHPTNSNWAPRHKSNDSFDDSFLISSPKHRPRPMPGTGRNDGSGGGSSRSNRPRAGTVSDEPNPISNRDSRESSTSNIGLSPNLNVKGSSPQRSTSKSSSFDEPIEVPPLIRCTSASANEDDEEMNSVEGAGGTHAGLLSKENRRFSDTEPGVAEVKGLQSSTSMLDVTSMASSTGQASESPKSNHGQVAANANSDRDHSTIPEETGDDERTENGEGYNEVQETKSNKIDWEEICDGFERPQRLYFSGMEPKEEKYIVNQAEDRISTLVTALHGTESLRDIVIPPKTSVHVGVVMFFPTEASTPPSAPHTSSTSISNGLDQERNLTSSSGKLHLVRENLWIEHLNLDNEDMERIKKIHLWSRADEKEIKFDKRAVPVVAKVAHSVMSFAQRHINFGVVKLPCHRYVKTLFLTNESALPLLYKIRKSGSFSSGFLRIVRNPVGMVRPYGTKEIQIEFHPTMPGRINEKLTVVNIMDRSCSLGVMVKADVVRPVRFTVDTEELKFTCEKRNSNIQVLQVRNTHHKRREFALKLKEVMLPFRVRFSSFASSKPIPPEVGEQIENLQHKYRIAETKNQVKKLKQIRAKLDELYAQGNIQQEDHTRLVALPSGAAKLVIPAEATAKVQLQAYVSQEDEEEALHSIGKQFQSVLQIYQVKNKEAVWEVPIYVSNHLYQRSATANNLQSIHIRDQVAARGSGAATPPKFRGDRHFQHADPMGVVNPGRTPSMLQNQGLYVSPRKVSERPTSVSPRILGRIRSPERRGFRPIVGGSGTPMPTTPTKTVRPFHGGAHSKFDVTPKVIDFGAITCDKEILHAKMTISRTDVLVATDQKQSCHLKVSVMDHIENVHFSSNVHALTVPINISKGKGGRHNVPIKIQLIGPGGQPEAVKTIMVKYNVMYIHFLDLDENLTGMPSILDFGFCYVTERCEIEPRPLRVKNIFNKDLVLSIMSNLKRQVAIFTDVKKREPVDMVTVKPGQVLSCWVLIEPRLLEENSRILSGGIQVFMEDVFTCTVKVKAIVGISQWNLENTQIRIMTNRPETELVVENKTKKLPLRIRIVLEETNESLIHVDDKTDFEIPANEKMSIPISVVKSPPNGATFMIQRFYVENLITGEKIPVTVDILVPPSDAFLAGLCYFGDLVVPTSYVDDDFKLQRSGTYLHRFKNPFPDQNLSVRVKIHDSEDVSPFSARIHLPNQEDVCCLALKPKQEGILRIELNESFDFTPERNPAGNTYSGILLLELNRTVVQMLNVEAMVEKLRLELQPMVVNLGKILNGVDTEIPIQVMNYPEGLELDTKIVYDDENGEERTMFPHPENHDETASSSSQFPVEGSVEQLGPKILVKVRPCVEVSKDVGNLPVSMHLQVINRWNPSDRSIVPIHGNIICNMVKVPGFVELPPLTIPAPENADPLDCNVWFTVENVFGEPVEFAVNITLKQDWESYVQTFLRHRVSNVEITSLKLGAEEKKDIRVALVPKEGARLPEGDYNRVVIGSVSISAQGLTSKVDLRASLLAGKTFALSTSQLNFYTKRLKQGGNELVVSSKSLEEGFWVRNISKKRALRVGIRTTPLELSDGDVLVLNEEGVCANQVLPAADQDEYVIEPERSTFIPIRLLESSSTNNGPNNGTSHVNNNNTTNGGDSSILRNKSILRVVDLESPDSEEKITVSVFPDMSSSDEEQASPKSSHLEATTSSYDEDDEDVKSFPSRPATPQQQFYDTSSKSRDTEDEDGGFASATFSPRGSNLDTMFSPRSSSSSRSLNVDEHIAPRTPPPFLSPLYSMLPTHFDAPPSSGLPPPLSSTSNTSAAFVDDGSADSVSTKGGDDSEGSLVLRGCTPISGSNARFEVDIGQREFGSGSVSWEINVENTGAHPVEYDLILVDPTQSSWIEMSRTSGVLESEHEFHSITFKFSTDQFGSFSTYLILVENKFCNIKVIHVSLDVVATSFGAVTPAKLGIGGEGVKGKFFSVAVSGQEFTESNEHAEIDMGIIVEGWNTTWYSFSIKNQSHLPLSFLLSHNVPKKSTIRFSSGPGMAMEFQRLTIPSSATQRAYLVLNPINDLTKYNPVVTVSCDNIKDHAINILVRVAKVIAPEFAVEIEGIQNNEERVVELFFNLNSPERQSYYNAKVTNLSEDHEKEITLTSTSPFFECIAPATTFRLKPKESINLTIRLNSEKLSRSKEMSRNSSYVSGHLFISAKVMVGDIEFHQRKHFALHCTSGSGRRWNLVGSDKSLIEERVLQIIALLFSSNNPKAHTFDSTHLLLEIYIITDILIYLASKATFGRFVYTLASLVFNAAIQFGSSKYRAIYLQEMRRFLSTVPNGESALVLLQQYLPTEPAGASQNNISTAEQTKN